MLREALAWKRDTPARLDYDDVDGVLMLRGWITLDDLLASTSVFGDEAPLTIVRDQALMLCELAVYLRRRARRRELPAARGARPHRGPAALTGPLMDCCCEFAAAQEEVELREPPLPV